MFGTEATITTLAGLVTFLGDFDGLQQACLLLGRANDMGF
jgi:hypothetical protein